MSPLPSNMARTVLSNSGTENDIPAWSGGVASDHGRDWKVTIKEENQSIKREKDRLDKI